MKNKLTSIGIVGLLLVGLLIGFINHGSEWAIGTNVNGTVYDGYGGPWTLIGSPYIVIGDVFIPPGQTLTIEPGVEVKFDGFFSIYIDGSLTAVGLAANRIFITSNMGTPSPGDWKGIWVNPLGNAEIINCDISYGAFGIYLDSSSNNNIADNNIAEINYYGIFLHLSSNNNIVGNKILENSIGIFGDSLMHWNSHNIDETNTVNGKPVYYWKNKVSGEIPSGAGQVILANCSNVKIKNQELTHGSIGIELGFSSNNSIMNNNASFHNLHGDNISGDIPTTFFYGIYLYNSHFNTISDNIATDDEFAISLSYSDGNDIRNNKIHKTGYGVELLQSNGNIVFNNEIIEEQWGSGIYLFESSMISIMQNYIFEAGKGIYIQNSDGIIVTNNNISSSLGDGIRCWISTNVVIMENDIWKGDGNIELSVQSTGVKVFHNNIIDNNGYQAVDGESNIWDDSYPSGGNYWSDFDEPSEGAFDDYQGPEQDILGSDGIVDKGIAAGGGKNPYVIDADSQDMYPLIEPHLHIMETIGLSEGWNLISIPFIQSNTNIDTVLSSISGAYDAVQWYNGGDLSDHWKHYHSSKPTFMNDLNKIDHTMGLWIHITQPGGIIFDCPGTQPTGSQKISLTPGWNLVGYPSTIDRKRTDALGNIVFDSDVDAIWTYNATTQNWEEVGELDYFVVGNGYWVHSKVTTTWNVPL
jgi:parallel beta-helix repeat protein